MPNSSRKRYAVGIVTLACAGVAFAAFGVDYPPLCTEISEEHPLFIFEVRLPEGGAAAEYAQRAAQCWADLPVELKPFSALQLDLPGIDLAVRHRQFRDMLQTLQGAEVPVVLRLADGDPRRIYPLERAEELLRDFACVKGIQAVGFRFDEYFAFGDYDPIAAPPQVRWLAASIETCARYGRFAAVELEGLGWPRVMANTWCKPLYERMKALSSYVIPIDPWRGRHNLTQQSAILGLWFEGAAAHWGVGPRSGWYSDADCIEPGVFGKSAAPDKMPSSYYRAMILAGAMTGAHVYSFAPESDLWFGPAQRHWQEAIYPTLSEILDKRFIARQDFVQKKIKVAYRLAAAGTSEDFHLDLRDIDAVSDAGFLVRAAYGIDNAYLPELVPNTGRFYWIPLLSPYADDATVAKFSVVVTPGQMASTEAWAELLARYYDPEGAGTAFLSKVGRGVFVMNTAENAFVEQAVHIDALPAPVRGFEARSTDAGIDLTWPFREGDLSYRVYKRVEPAVRWTLVAGDVGARQYVDTQVARDVAVAYAVTALTNEMEPFDCPVYPGAYLVFSVVESRIAEEVTVSPVLGYAKSRPIESAAPPAAPPERADLAGLTDAQYALAKAIDVRLDEWARAFREENLGAVLDLYSTEYEDPESWRFQYVRRAYQWFFERYSACAMFRQIRRWDFAAYDANRQVDVLMFCRFDGVALTDATGRFADVAASFPQLNNGEVTVTLTDRDGPWRILRTNPAVPNFRDMLSFSAAPADALTPGPDVR